MLENHAGIVTVSDDIYEHIHWADEPFVKLRNRLPRTASDRTVTINGVSKAYAMTGWRIGYAAGPRSLITAMKTVQSQSTSNPCSISQVAAEAGTERRPAARCRHVRRVQEPPRLFGGRAQ